jgi:hypothetical protein
MSTWTLDELRSVQGILEGLLARLRISVSKHYALELADEIRFRLNKIQGYRAGEITLDAGDKKERILACVLVIEGLVMADLEAQEQKR